MNPIQLSRAKCMFIKATIDHIYITDLGNGWILDIDMKHGSTTSRYVILRDPPNVPCSAERSKEGSVIFSEFSVPLFKGGTGKAWETFIFPSFKLFYNYPS